MRAYIAKTKIIATIGPACDSETVLRKMMQAGLDIARLNFSHGSHQEHQARLLRIRTLNIRYRRALKVMQDLAGYRIRIGALSQETNLKRKQVFYLTQKPCKGCEKEAFFDYRGSLKGIKKGNHVYIDDGKIKLQVTGVERNRLKTEVVIGGLLKDRKGVNIPDARIEFEAITEKDKIDLEFAIANKLEYVAQSFVNRARDVFLLRALLKDRHPDCKIFSKIESKAALKNLDEIIKASDAIIVARGDLGVCLPIYEVAIIQKAIAARYRFFKKPMVVATQMLDSMTDELLPTRAEVSDVSNAILDGAGYLLLSSETAVGKHPDMVVHTMNRIIQLTEQYKNNFYNPLSR